MTTDLVTDHIYHRDIDPSIRTSLSVISELIGQNAQVLDLGTGSGALGKQLSQQQGCQVDGVTYNSHEAEIAQTYYRHVEVADLETCSLTELFPNIRYDFVVCADVLEHIRNPERLALICKDLLLPGGKLLVSVPNLSYCGLVAELMDGEFLYREEGLLDRTHVRFFTRRSLARFFQGSGWDQSRVEVIERPLNDSEFKVHFDALPPSVSRHLLALPDAMAYQFVAVASPANTASQTLLSTNTGGEQSVGKAYFSSQLYLRGDDGFAEDRKLVKQGVIGKERQTLTFSIPNTWRDFRHLRFDPADRVGYFYLYKLTMLVDGKAVWAWRLDEQGVAQIGEVAHHQIIFRPPIAGGGSALLFLTGSDPWIALPIPDHARETISANASVSIEVEMGWPMSADYLALADSVQTIRAATDAREQYVQVIQEENQRNIHNIQYLASREVQLERTLNLLQEEFSTSLAFANTQRERLQAEKQVVVAEKQVVMAEKQALIAEHLLQLDALNSGNAELRVAVELAETNARALIAEKKTLSDDRADLVARLSWIENSRLFRYTRPLIRAKMRINPLLRYLWGKKNVLQTNDWAPSVKPAFQIDIIVPVYKGLEDTQRCIVSALGAQCQTPFRLIAINDASPEPAVTAWLREISLSDSRVLLLENEVNLGFVATVNRGMSVSDSHDVVLLNSDTEVANDWLDRLKNAAYVSEKVGTVTPFSNNATICSYPSFCEENPMIAGHTTASLDQLFAAANSGEVVDIPTGVGFCMYIRRECLSAVGLFDVANFGKGYGEENDFCRRAAAAGWRNLHALDTFVLHAGGVSFGASKNERVLAALQTLARLYPDYDALVQDYIKRDPAWTARTRIDALRIQASNKPAVLFVLHDRSGGTVRHASELAEHLVEKAMIFALTPLAGKRIGLRLLGRSEGFRLEFALPHEWDDLLKVLKLLGIGSIHFHHFIGHEENVKLLPQLLGIPYDFTAHDYYTYCPQISLTDRSNKYCGELGLDQCRRCLAESPAPGGVSIEAWHGLHKPFLLNARRIFAPSVDCKVRIARFSGRQDIIYCPHTDLPMGALLTKPEPRALQSGEALKIAVIGALSPIKGADVLDDVAQLASRCSADLSFHLIGYAYRQLRVQPDAPLTVHGAYAEHDLAKILTELQPHLVWFPALWPETYSYTLSAALLQGLPIVGPDLGAFAERLEGREWSWIASLDKTPADWVTWFQAIRATHFDTGLGPVPVKASNPSRLEWSYLDNYVDSAVQTHAVGTLAHDCFYPYRPNQVHPDRALNQDAKAFTLKLATQLRSSQWLSGAVRRIPLRWQTRLKSWLLA